MKEEMKNIVELEISKEITRVVREVFPTKHPKEVVVEWLKSIHKSSTFDEYYEHFGFIEEDIDEGDVWEVEPHYTKIYETPNEKPEGAWRGMILFLTKKSKSGLTKRRKETNPKTT